MFNHFRPKRPDSLTPRFWRSEKGDKAYDRGYERYCEVYYKNLGTEHYTRHEAENYAQIAGYHQAMIIMAAELESIERKSKRV